MHAMPDLVIDDNSGGCYLSRTDRLLGLLPISSAVSAATNVLSQCLSTENAQIVLKSFAKHPTAMITCMHGSMVHSTDVAGKKLPAAQKLWKPTGRQ